jgi:hypothetical protein
MCVNWWYAGSSGGNGGFGRHPCIPQCHPLTFTPCSHIARLSSNPSRCFSVSWERYWVAYMWTNWMVIPLSWRRNCPRSGVLALGLSQVTQASTCQIFIKRMGQDFLYFNNINQTCCSRDCTLHLYLGDAWFEFQSGHWLSCGFPQCLQQNAWIVPWLGHDLFLLNRLQIIIHQSSYHLMLYSLRYWRHHKITHKRK